MSSFQDLGVFVHNNPGSEAQRSYAHSALNQKTEKDHARNSSGFMPQDYYEQKTLNLEKTTFSVLFVFLLIYV